MASYRRARQMVAEGLFEVMSLGREEHELSPVRGALQHVAQWLQDSGTWLERLEDGKLPQAESDGNGSPKQ